VIELIDHGQEDGTKGNKLGKAARVLINCGFISSIIRNNNYNENDSNLEHQ
jgi:hypothetical protein